MPKFSAKNDTATAKDGPVLNALLYVEIQQLRRWVASFPRRPSQKETMAWIEKRFGKKIAQYTISRYLSSRYAHVDALAPDDASLQATRPRVGQWPTLEKMLFEWQQAQPPGSRSTGNEVLQAKALEIWMQSQEAREGEASTAPRPTLGANWVRMFKERHGLKRRNSRGKPLVMATGSEDAAAAETTTTTTATATTMPGAAGAAADAEASGNMATTEGETDDDGDDDHDDHEEAEMADVTAADTHIPDVAEEVLVASSASNNNSNSNNNNNSNTTTTSYNDTGYRTNSNPNRNYSNTAFAASGGSRAPDLSSALALPSGLGKLAELIRFVQESRDTDKEDLLLLQSLEKKWDALVALQRARAHQKDMTEFFTRLQGAQ